MFPKFGVLAVPVLIPFMEVACMPAVMVSVPSDV